MRYTLYVPAPGAIHDIRAGSAIVGEEKDGCVSTHYEGGGRAENVQTYEERINQAAGRRSQGYPTSALRGWRPEEVVAVGTVVYSTALRHWVVDTIVDETALRGWIGMDDAVRPGGSDKLLVNEGARRFSDLPPRDQQRIAAMRLPPPALAAEIIATFERLIAEPD